MKNIISKYLVFTGIALAMTVSAFAQQMGQATAKIVRIKGAAQYATADNVWKTLKVGDVLSAGSIIQTAKDSRVDLVLGKEGDMVLGSSGPGAVGGGAGSAYQPVVEQDFVRVWEDSVLAIDKLSVTDTGTDKITETQLDLRAGRIFGTVKKLSPSSIYEIKIPNAVAGIRGTIYSISAAGILNVSSGAVGIAYSGAGGAAKTQMVGTGQSFDCRTEQLTQMATGDWQEMRVASREARVGVTVGTTVFPEDTTTEYISPVQGGGN